MGLFVIVFAAVFLALSLFFQPKEFLRYLLGFAQVALAIGLVIGMACLIKFWHDENKRDQTVLNSIPSAVVSAPPVIQAPPAIAKPRPVASRPSVRSECISRQKANPSLNCDAL